MCPGYVYAEKEVSVHPKIPKFFSFKIPAKINMMARTICKLAAVKNTNPFQRMEDESALHDFYQLSSPITSATHSYPIFILLISFIFSFFQFFVCFFLWIFYPLFFFLLQFLNSSVSSFFFIYIIYFLFSYFFLLFFPYSSLFLFPLSLRHSSLYFSHCSLLCLFLFF